MLRFLLALLVIIISSSSFAADKESAYDRVMRTGTIRCGYGMNPPYDQKDPNTGQLSGIFYDYVEALAQSLSLKVEWAEEMGWGDFPTALRSGRIDAFCAPSWITGGRAREVDWVLPVTYQPTVIAVRADDHRFDDLSKLNDAAVTFVEDEGGSEVKLVKTFFPKAKINSIHEIDAVNQTFMNVVTKKADASLTQAITFAAYDKAHPGELRALSASRLIQMSAEGIAVGLGQYELHRMLSNATQELLTTGKINQIVQSYKLPEGSIYVPQSSYVKP